MSFFNKKEDVLQVELTQFGKHLLSQGKWDPAYYSFYDDDIIYDHQYAGVTSETGSGVAQNLIEGRIKEVPRNRVQHVYTGIEAQVKRNNLLIRRGELIQDGNSVFVGKKANTTKEFMPTNDTNFSSYAPLGTSNLVNNYMPAWNITLFDGKLNNTAIQLTSSATSIGQKIPQLDTTVEYFVVIEKVNDNKIPNITEDEVITQDLYSADDEVVGGTANVLSPDFFEDDSYIKIVSRDLLLKVEEFNAPYTNDNFDIEVYEMSSSQDLAGNQHQVWTPLYFPKKGNVVAQGVPTSVHQESDLSLDFPDVNSTYVEYFFELNVDNEIEDQDLCAVISQDKTKDVYDLERRCPDYNLIKKSQKLGEAAVENIYSSPIKTEDIEECD